MGTNWHPDNLVPGKRYAFSYIDAEGLEYTTSGEFLHMQGTQDDLWVWFETSRGPHALPAAAIHNAVLRGE